MQSDFGLSAQVAGSLEIWWRGSLYRWLDYYLLHLLCSCNYVLVVQWDCLLVEEGLFVYFWFLVWGWYHFWLVYFGGSHDRLLDAVVLVHFPHKFRFVYRVGIAWILCILVICNINSCHFALVILRLIPLISAWNISSPSFLRGQPLLRLYGIHFLELIDRIRWHHQIVLNQFI